MSNAATALSDILLPDPLVAADVVRTGIFQFEHNNACAALGTATDIQQRRRFWVPTDKIIRYRPVVVAEAFLTDTPATGSITNLTSYFGELELNALTGEPTGNFTAAPVQSVMSSTTLNSGNKSVGAWVNNATLPLKEGRQYGIANGYHIGASDQISAGGGEQWYNYTASDAAVAAPVGGLTRVGNQGFLDIFIEVQFADDSVTVRLNHGNSLSGGGNAASPVYDNHGEWDSWGGQWARKGRGFLPSLAVAGSWAANYPASATNKYNWYDGCDIPLVLDDCVYLAFNSSDIAGTGGSSAQITTAENNMIAAILATRAKWPNRFEEWVSNNPPRVASTGSGATAGTLEYARLTVNKWLESSPCGVTGAFDIDSLYTDWANPARQRPVFDPGDGTHLRPRGYALIAGAAPRGKGRLNR